MLFRFRIAPPDGTIRVVILGTFLLFGGLTFWTVSGEETEALDFILLLLVWGPLAVAWLFAPCGYLVSREGIVIRRAVGSFTIPAAEVESVEFVGRVRPGIRLAASGGFFGWFGLFTLKDGGTAKVYATRWDRTVRIKASREIYLFSPAEPEAFVEAVHRTVLDEAKLQEGKSSREKIFSLAPADPETRIALLLPTISLGVLSLVGVAAGVSDPAELPGVLAVLGGLVPVTVLLVAVFFAFAPAAYILDAQGRGLPGVSPVRCSCLTRRSGTSRCSGFPAYLSPSSGWAPTRRGDSSVISAGSRWRAWDGSGSTPPPGRTRWWCWKRSGNRTFFPRRSRKGSTRRCGPGFAALRLSGMLFARFLRCGLQW